ncbi:MAG: MFS transporter [Gemmatimonadetes bacterium]|nr:MFS transporter [Gemmatimonadota bacterium]
MRALLGGNVLWLSVISLLNDTASEMIYPLLPFFLVSILGAGPAFLGLVEGIAETTASLVKLAGGWLSDRLRRRKALVGWGYGLAAAARPFIALAGSPWHVLGLRFADRVGKGVRSAPRDALLAESVPANRRGTAFGLNRAADHAGAVLGPLVASGLLLLLPGRLRLVFALAAIPGIIAVLLLLWRVREVFSEQGRAVPPRDATPAPPAPPTPDAAPGVPVPPGLPAWAELDPAFRRYLLVVVLFTLGNSSDAFLLLRAQQLGISLAVIPLLWGFFHVSKMLWSVPGGMLADRFGSARAIIAGWLIYALVYAGFAVAGVAWHGWALLALYGLFFGLTEAPEKALVAALARPDRRGLAFGAFHFAVGVAALPASLLFGFLWSRLGAETAFLVGAAFALISALLLPIALRRA